jgi:hypothetical protein
MKNKDVEIGQVYKAKVSNKHVKVKILREAERKGWHALNLATFREVYIKTGQRLTPCIHNLVLE